MREPLEAELALNIKKFASSIAQAEQRVTRMAANIDGKTKSASKRVEAALAGQAQGWMKLGQVTGAQRFVLQNTANQIGDIAVQLSMGTSALRVFGMQMPQVLGGFSALGGTLGVVAPILGTLAAVAFPAIALALASAGEETKTLEENIKSLQQSVSEVNTIAQSYSSQGLQAMLDKYGEVNAELLVLLERQKQYAINQSTQNARGAATSLREEISGALAVLADLETAQARLAKISKDTQPDVWQDNYEIVTMLTDQLTKAADEMGLTVDQVRELSAAIAVMEGGGSFEEMAAAAARVNDVLEDTPLALTETYGKTLQVESAMRELANSAPQANWMDAALRGVEALGESIRKRIMETLALKSEAGAMTSSPRPMPRGQGTVIDLRNEGGGSRGRSGGGKQTEAMKEDARLLSEAKALLESLKTPAEKLAEQFERIDKMAAKGLITEDQADAAKQRLEKLQPVAKSVADALSKAFTSAFDDPKKALEDLAKELAMLALRMQLVKSFPGVFGAGGIIPLAAASGGFIQGPGTGRSDSIPARLSNGEFVVNAKATAQHRKLLEVINSGKTLSLASGGYVGAPAIPRLVQPRGGGGAPIINLHNEGVPAEVSRVEQSKGPGARETFDIWLNESLASGRAARGLKVNGVQRPKVMR